MNTIDEKTMIFRLLPILEPYFKELDWALRGYTFRDIATGGYIYKTGTPYGVPENKLGDICKAINANAEVIRKTIPTFVKVWSKGEKLRIKLSYDFRK